MTHQMSIEKKPRPARFSPAIVLASVRKLEDGHCVTLRMSRTEQANLIRAAKAAQLPITTGAEKRGEKPDDAGRRTFNVWKK